MDALEPLAAGSSQPATSASDTPDGTPAGLSSRDVRILDFERHWWRHAGSKEQAIRDRFALSPTRYYQLLNELLERPEALAHDPILVKRLKRLRTYRQRQRVARLLGAEYTPGRR